jgi:hypothetical protein
MVCILYVLSYLDRGNIENAKTAGVQKALHLGSTQVKVLSLLALGRRNWQWAEIVDLGLECLLYMLLSFRMDSHLVENLPCSYICFSSLCSVSHQHCCQNIR